MISFLVHCTKCHRTRSNAVTVAIFIYIQPVWFIFFFRYYYYSFIHLFIYLLIFFLVFCWVMLLLSSYNITILKDIYESRKISVYYTYIYRIVSTSRSALDLFFFSFLLVIPLSFPSRYLSNLRLNLSFIFFVFFVFFAFFVSSSL